VLVRTGGKEGGKYSGVICGVHVYLERKLFHLMCVHIIVYNISNVIFVRSILLHVDLWKTFSFKSSRGNRLYNLSLGIHCLMFIFYIIFRYILLLLCRMFV